MRVAKSTLVCFALLLGTLFAAGAASAADSVGGQLPAEVSAAGTPQVLDGQVNSVVQVGNSTVLGGSFTQARNDSATTGSSYQHLLAFDTTTKKLSTTFLPQPNGVVNAVLPTGDGSTVYVGGNFTSIGGVARKNLARVRVSDGAVISTFNAGSVAGQVLDLKLASGRLWVAGAFTAIAGSNQLGLATVNPTTGAYSSYMAHKLSGLHNGGYTTGMKIDISPDSKTLVLIGNFDQVDGVKHHQIAMFDISGTTAQLSSFNTTFYQQACSSSFNSYMRDVAFSPDSSYFVVATTGAYGGAGSACDSTARFETSVRDTAVVPSWVDDTGGDTQQSVEITDSAVYTGGHMRWQNNPFAGDRAGQGAVARTGLSALDPQNGLPLTWNPTRDRGIGVFDFLPTTAGLWIGSDTTHIGTNYALRSRIALMPFTGAQFPSYKTPGLPNDVYSVQPTGTSKRSYANGAFSQPSPVPVGGITAGTVRGSFMLNGQLYLASSDGTFTRRTFDGTTYGQAVPVNTADQIVPLTDWQNDIRTMTGLFYDNGRMYFTLSGSSSLYYRFLSPQSDVVGAQRLVASGSVAGIDFSTVQGMFKAGSRLYFTNGDGSLHSIAWNDLPIAGQPVAGTADVVSGPTQDSNTWASPSTLFLFQDAHGDPAFNHPPVSTFTTSCTELACSFDGSGSTDQDGTIASYAWDFGDGTKNTSGARVSHTYTGAGTYTVSLTVTDNGGATTTRTSQVNVTLARLAFVAAASTNGNRTAHTVTVPSSVQAGDQLLAYLSTNDSTVTATTPAGWTDVTSQVISSSGTAVRVWKKTATASDAGSAVTTTSSAYTKSDMSVAAYRSSTGAVGVADSASALSSATTASHTTPTVQATAAGEWLVSYWGTESSVTTTWAPPASETLRTSSVGTGGGNISAILTDGNGPVQPGTVGGLTATTSGATTRTPMVSITLATQ